MRTASQNVAMTLVSIFAAVGLGCAGSGGGSTTPFHQVSTGPIKGINMVVNSGTVAVSAISNPASVTPVYDLLLINSAGTSQVQNGLAASGAMPIDLTLTHVPRVMAVDSTANGGRVWCTSDNADGSQTLGVMGPDGQLLASTGTADAKHGVIPLVIVPPILVSPVQFGAVDSGGRFLTPRVTTEEAGTVTSSLFAYDPALAGSPTRSVIQTVNDLVLQEPMPTLYPPVAETVLPGDTTVCALGQYGLASISSSGSTITPFSAPLSGGVLNIANGEAPTEVVILTNSQLLVADGASGATRSINLGNMMLSSASRVFTDSGVAFVVGDTQVASFNLTDGTPLGVVSLPVQGAVLGAGVSNGRLFVLQSGPSSDSLFWADLNDLIGH